MSGKCPGPHKYKRIKLKENKHVVFKCVLCPHYVLEFQVIGRKAQCWYCDNIFTMSHKSLLLKPHCGCRSGNNDTNLKGFKERVQEVPKIPLDIRNELIDHLIAKALGGVKE